MSDTGKEKRGYLSPEGVKGKGAFSTDNAANSMKRKYLALITALFCAYMEPLCHVSRGKTGEADTGKRDYRNREWPQNAVVLQLAPAHGCRKSTSVQPNHRPDPCYP